MNKPLIKSQRRKASKANKQTFQQLISSQDGDRNANEETTIYASGAVLNQSVNVNYILYI